ncbi:MAG: ABC transporter permease [Bacteroidetes bacterium]|nr:ABC transporter permease [Bacteroidota bacterium]
MRRKSLLIIRSEFMRRVTSKTFIVTTLLGPVLFVGFIIAIGVISLTSIEDDLFEDQIHRIAIIDETGVLSDLVLSHYIGAHSLIIEDHETALNEMVNGGLDAYILIPEEVLFGNGDPVLYSKEGNFYGIQLAMQSVIDKSLKDYLLSEENVPDHVQSILNRSVFLDLIQLGEDQQEPVYEGEDVEFGYVMFGVILGMMMYIGIMIYGTLILYGVIEERSTRVVEIIVSSVRPFDLLMGKVLGIGLVGFVQIATWMVMIIGGMVLTSLVMAGFIDPMMYGIEVANETQEILSSINMFLPNVTPWMILCFILFFIGGYLLYGALFAAVGSLVDSPQESQTLLIPVMMPLIVSVTFLSSILLNPNSHLAIGLSLFPLTSPAPMMVRLALGAVPTWQILLSLGLLVASIFGSIWVSARIYKATVLTYDNKVSLKTIFGYLRGV